MAVAVLDKLIARVRQLSVNGAARSDADLLKRFAGDADQAAFAELVRRHGAMVLAVCRRVLHHEQDAEDAFQAAFLVLARKASSIRPEGSVSGWLYQVAHRIALRAKACANRRRCSTLHHEMAAESPRAGEPSLAAALAEELPRLPEQYRSAIVLCYLEGKTQSEAARLLAITADAVNSRLKRARELLRHRLARHGLPVAAATVAAALSTPCVEAGITDSLVAQTAQAAIQFMTHPASAAASPAAVALAQGALHTMIPTKFKLATSFLAALFLVVCGAATLWSMTQDDSAPPVQLTAFAKVAQPQKKPAQAAKVSKRCIILWMNGGPSQIDTFDPKPGNVALFKAIDTNVKGLQFSEVLPKLAKQANHLAILRSVTHREGDHTRGSFLMHTGYAAGGVAYPSLGCVLAKELGGGMTDLPRFVAIDSPNISPGLLGVEFAPLKAGKQALAVVGPADDLIPELPSADDIKNQAKDNADAMRKNVAKAFNLAEEKVETRNAYGKNRFGNACLVARRMSERGVPVIEISLSGWDTHGAALGQTQLVAAKLDAGFAALVKDLHERKLLDQTLIVWMGEFGRTPRINGNGGRDHYPLAFTVVLAGAGIKGGQAIGKTDDDGIKVLERPVTPQELFATIYQSLGINPQNANKTAGGQAVPFVEKGNHSIKEALR